MNNSIVCLTFDFDTQSGFIARGMTTPTPLSRGEFGAIGARRILDTLKVRDIKEIFESDVLRAQKAAAAKH